MNLEDFRQKIFRKTNGKCYYCGKMLEKSWHVEHKQPASRGGENSIENLVPSCRACNLEKATKNYAEFLEFKRAQMLKLLSEFEELFFATGASGRDWSFIGEFYSLKEEIETCTLQFRGEHEEVSVQSGFSDKPSDYWLEFVKGIWSDDE